ncbi:hypothetical protein QN277_026350 [Acacia crassicarpa]|uniref:Prolamin-like domain-containing protein n=1 Tax=Acacia crassicarpa TaxID=499986 RepID=A0AAE1JAM6_9FABA|nr:hypothetical protein QN277_026350 [Acacia crassicarpa]
MASRSKSSNFFSVLFCALIMFLNVVPKAQARDMTIFADKAKCYTLLADVPGSKEYCTRFLESSSSPSPSSDDIRQPYQDLEKCWSSLRSIQGCVADIFFALFSGDFSKLEHDCCQAIESIVVDCWLKMFPWNPMFPTLLLNSCKNL